MTHDSLLRKIEKHAAERYPFASALRPAREALAKLDPKPKQEPVPPAKPNVPSGITQKKRRC